jgi:hypothetical protein
MAAKLNDPFDPTKQNAHYPCVQVDIDNQSANEFVYGDHRMMEEERDLQAINNHFERQLEKNY